MTTIRKFWSTPLSRRSLLEGAVSVVGAAAILFSAAYSARAAKMSKPSVTYQPSPKAGAKCSGCSLFVAPNACQSVEGSISPNGWCSIYSKA
jgi:High potential iron-sulfur protein